MSRSLTALVAILATAACTHPPRRNTLVGQEPQTGNPEAHRRFQNARAKFLHDGKVGKEFAQIAQDYPQDPIVPWAELYDGIAAVKAHDFPRASTALSYVIEANADKGLTLRAQMFLGISKSYAGDYAGARPLLAKTAAATENDDERLDYTAAVAYSTAAGDHPLASLTSFDAWWAKASPTERAVIVERVEVVVAGADKDGLEHAFAEITDRNGPSMAVVASRLAEIDAQTGDSAGAAKMREAANPARAAVGLPRTITAADVPTGGGPGLVGAILPLGAKNQGRVNDATISALGLVAGAAGGPGVAAIELRAAGASSEAAAQVEELAKANVVAIIGPIDDAAVDVAGGRAEGLGVPLLSLASRPEERTGGKYVFHMRHSAVQRGRALAKRALAKGVTTFFVLAPENGYGKAVAAGFAQEVDKGGGTIVGKVTYAANTKSFATPAGRMSGSFAAVFVADTAENLELIAPAIATAGFYPKPLGTKKVVGGKPVLLLSTADGLSAAFAANAGRYAEGAMLAPGFYADTQDAATKPFIDRFVAAYGKVPSALEAYAYDAAQLAVAAGAGGRGALAAALASRPLEGGLTGTIQFDADHLRSDLGNVYTVVDDNGAYAIRAQR